MQKKSIIFVSVLMLAGIHTTPQGRSSSAGYDAIFFQNGQEGYLREFRPFGQEVLRTVDGGKTWRSVLDQPPAVGVSFRRGRVFLDRQLGWSIVEDSWPHKNVYKTIDGGIVWHKCNLPGGTSASSLTGIHAVSAKEVWVVGTESYRTIDGGQTWKQLPFSGNMIFVLPRRFVWALSNVLWKSSDGGNSWREIKFAKDVVRGLGNGDLFFLNDRLGWIVGGRREGDLPDGRQTSAVLVTFDGGETWTRISEIPNSLLTAVFFMNERIGWVAGSDGTVLKTSDGGRTWNRP
jgi:photosystem II stability/assembly factor-like uncharacterized protein